MLQTYPDMVAEGTALPGASSPRCWHAAAPAVGRLEPVPFFGQAAQLAVHTAHCRNEGPCCGADAPERDIQIDTSYRWARSRYNTVQRTAQFWAFALTLRARLTLMDQRWSYPGGFTEEKCALASLLACAHLQAAQAARCPGAQELWWWRRLAVEVQQLACRDLHCWSCSTGFSRTTPHPDGRPGLALLTGLPLPRKRKRMRKLAAWTRDSFLNLGPLFIKIGQLFATRADLLPAEATEVRTYIARVALPGCRVAVAA